MNIHSIQKAIHILNIVSENKNIPITISKLSEITHINISTCSHIVSTLNHEGYLKKISHTKGYVLGPAVYCLNNHDRYERELIDTCRPILNWLYKRTNKTVVLATIENGQKFIVDYIDNEHLIFKESFEIQRDSLYRTATGRIIMAHMSIQELENIYNKHGVPKNNHWDEVTSLETLYKEVKKINKKQVLKTVYATANSCTLSIGFAAAIYKNTECIGAIGVAECCTVEEYKNLIKKDKFIENTLLKARNEISRRLGF